MRPPEEWEVTLFVDGQIQKFTVIIDNIGIPSADAEVKAIRVAGSQGAQDVRAINSRFLRYLVPAPTPSPAPQWLPVTPGTMRLAVPGGWLYRVCVGDALSTCFVPAPSNVAPGAHGMPEVAP